MPESARLQLIDLHDLVMPTARTTLADLLGLLFVSTLEISEAC